MNLQRVNFPMISCSGAKIENAQIKNVSVRQMMELTYNGREQLPEVTATGSTIGGTAITFHYGLTAEQAADENEWLNYVPAFTDAAPIRYTTPHLQ